MDGSGGDLGQAQGSIRLDASGAISALSSFESALKRTDAQSKSFGSGIGSFVQQHEQSIKTIGTGLAAVGVGITAAFGFGVKASMDFESAMSSVRAVTQGTDEQFKALSNTALRIGQDTAFSATEAAAAIEELAKAGVSTENILTGAADGAVALAAATGIQMPQAATAMANAMNIFGLSGDQATRVANVFAAASNKAATDVTQLQAGLAQGGAGFAMFGLSLEESVGALAMFSDYGIQGSDAATSINAALRTMSQTTGQSADAMNELGISLYDANGEFVGLDGVATQLREKLAGLTEEERNQYIQRLGGADGMRALNILYEEGAAGVQEYADAVTGTNAAEEAARIRMDNLRGVLEQIKGSLETLAITFTSRLLPALAAVGNAINAVVGFIVNLPAPVQTAIVAMTGLVGAASLAGGGFLLLLPRIKDTVDAFNDLKNSSAGARVVSTLSSPISKLSTALRAGVANAGGLRAALMGLARAHPVIAGLTVAGAALAVGYRTNFLGMRDAIDGVVGSVTSLTSDMRAAFNGVGEQAGIAAEDVASFAEATHVVDGVTIYTAFRTNADGEKEKVGEIVESYKNADGTTAQVLIKGDDGEYWATIDLATGEIRDAQINVQANTAPMTERINAALDVLKGRLEGTGLGFLVPVVSGAQQLVNWIGQAAAAVSGFVSTFQAAFANFNRTQNVVSAFFSSLGVALASIDFGRFQGIADVVIIALGYASKAAQAFGTAFSGTMSLIAALWQGHWSDALAHFGNVQQALSQGFTAIGDLARVVWSGIADGLNALARRVPALGKGLSELADVFDVLASMAENVWDALAAFAKGNWSKGFRKLGDAAEDAFDLLVEGVEAAVAIVSDLGELLQHGISSAFDWVADRAGAFGESVRTVGSMLSNAVGVVTNLAQALSALFAGNWSDFFGNLGEAAMDALQMLGEAMTLVPQLIRDAFEAIDWGAVGSTLIDGFQGALEGLQNLANNAFEWLNDAAEAIDFGAIGSVIQSGIQSALSGMSAALDWALDVGVPALAGWIVDVAGDIWGGIKTLAGWGSDAISGTIDLALSILDSLADNVMEGLSSAKEWVVKHVPWLSGIIGATETLAAAVLVGLSILSTVAQNAFEAVLSLKDWVVSKVGWLSSVLGQTDILAGAVSVGLSILSNMVQNVFDGIASVVDWIVSKVPFLDAMLGGTAEEDGSATASLSLKESLISNAFAGIGNAVGWIGRKAGWLVTVLGEGDILSGSVTAALSALEDFVSNAFAVWGDAKAWAASKLGWVGTAINEGIDLIGNIRIGFNVQESGDVGMQPDYSGETPADVPGFDNVVDPSLEQQGFFGNRGEQYHPGRVAGAEAPDASGWTTWASTIQTVTRAVGTAVSMMATAIQLAFSALIGPALATAATPWTTLQTTISTFATTAGTTISMFATAAQLGLQLVTTALGTAATPWTTLSTAIAMFATTSGTSLSLWATGTQLGLQLVTTALSTAGTPWTTLSTAITTFAATTGTTISMWATAMQLALQLVGTAMGQHATVYGPVGTVISTFATTAATAMSTFATTVQTAARTTATTVQTSLTTGFNQARTAVQTATQGMQTAMTTASSQMRSAAQTAAFGVQSALSSGMRQAVGNVRSILGEIPGIIAGVGGAAAGTARSVGANIGNAFASGMESALGRIQAAANAMVDAANAALRARAAIASPSKLFLQLGGYVGEGFELGIRSMIPDAARAAAALVAVPGRYGVPGYGDIGYRTARYASVVPQPAVTSITYGPTILTIPPDDWVRVAEMAERAPERAAAYLHQGYVGVSGPG